MKTKSVVAGILLSTVILGLSLGHTAKAVSELTPNLTPLSAKDLSIVVSNNKKYLRLSTTSWNNGSGPLEIRGSDKDRNTGKQKVYQRIYNSDNSSRDVLAGWFTYHKQHRHIHFDDYAVYTLETVETSEVKGTSTKQTFCIIDTDHVDASLPGSPPSSKYTVCNSQVQGMSVGWGDTYGSALAGQSIDVTRVPDGEYILKITIDPNNRITEANESDNVSMVRVLITGNVVTLVE